MPELLLQFRITRYSDAAHVDSPGIKIKQQSSGSSEMQIFGCLLLKYPVFKRAARTFSCLENFDYANLWSWLIWNYLYAARLDWTSLSSWRRLIEHPSQTELNLGTFTMLSSGAGRPWLLWLWRYEICVCVRVTSYVSDVFVFILGMQLPKIQTSVQSSMPLKCATK